MAVCMVLMVVFWVVASVCSELVGSGFWVSGFAAGCVWLAGF